MGGSRPPPRPASLRSWSHWPTVGQSWKMVSGSPGDLGAKGPLSPSHALREAPQPPAHPYPQAPGSEVTESLLRRADDSRAWHPRRAPPPRPVQGGLHRPSHQRGKRKRLGNQNPYAGKRARALAGDQDAPAWGPGNSSLQDPLPGGACGCGSRGRRAPRPGPAPAGERRGSLPLGAVDGVRAP